MLGIGPAKHFHSVHYFEPKGVDVYLTYIMLLVQFLEFAVRIVQNINRSSISSQNAKSIFNT
jgi:hypothetical protein